MAGCGLPRAGGSPPGRPAPAGPPGRGLLILSCSARKLAARQAAPAWRLYDGVLFRLCKRLQAEGEFPRDVGIRILSAEHGLIRPDTAIAPYDRRMDPDRAAYLRARLAPDVERAVREEDAAEVYLAMGHVYRLALPDEGFPRRVRVVFGGGEIGRMQAALHAWLRGWRPPCTQLPLWPPVL